MQELPRYRLMYTMGDGPWTELTLDAGEHTLGRSPDCDVQLPDAGISRQHARIEISAAGCFIVDLGSANGTQLDGKSLTPHRAKPVSSGQIITIAGFTLKVEPVSGITQAHIPGDDVFEEPATRVEEPGFEEAATRYEEAKPEEAATRVEGVGEVSESPVLFEATQIDEAMLIAPPGEGDYATRYDVSSMIGTDDPTLPLRNVILNFRKEGLAWETQTLDYGEYIFGRVPECDFILSNTRVSRRHARLVVAREGCYLYDLGSANGTQLEGNPLRPRNKTSLTSGQMFTIADFSFKVEFVYEGGRVATSQMGIRLPEGSATSVATVVAEAVPATPVTLRIMEQGSVFLKKPLERGSSYTIGRVSECDICLTGPLVSRQHARLDVTQEGAFITDLGSSNGTLVNGNKISPDTRVPITESTDIKIDEYSIRLEGLQVEEAAVTRVAADAHGAATRVSIPRLILRYQKGGGAWQEVELTEGQQDIGRGTDCEIRLDSQIISRHHARIMVRGQQVSIADLGSKNGVQMKGKDLYPNLEHALKAGDQFHIDEFTFEFLGSATAAASAATAVRPSAGALFAELPPMKDGATLIGADLGLDMDMGVPAVSSTPINLMGQERVAIGRDPDNQIVLNHPMISRYHAVIERMGKRTRVLDLHSANGVFVNGLPVENQTWLQQGDVIKVGPYQIQFTGNELRPSEAQSYTIDVFGLQKWVTKTVNLLKEISLSVGKNEFVALVGMSGAGKSTLMDAINGFRPATHGQVMVNGVDLYKNYGMYRDDIGNVPQKDIVHTELTPEQALDYAAQLRMPADTSKAERKLAVQETLNDLGLTAKKDVSISRLSGGQLKRVSIGVELLTKPRLFFLDEPTSGLDPGTEYEMMKLLRHLADQGRTIMIITHATKNVMFCDKAIILAGGGNLAFYGPPEFALEYFDQFRTNRERLEKDMEFDDIYRILEDESRGKPAEWRDRYLQSEYSRYVQPQHQGFSTMQAQVGAGRQQQGRRISGLRQFFILSSRTLRCMVQDKASLGLTLALAPVLGLMNFIWGGKLFNPVVGDTAKVMAMWFITAVIAILVGAMGSVREIVKENDIYKRERAVGLKILPYILSKTWLGCALAIYQGTVVLLALLILVRPAVSSLFSYGMLLVTMILAIICGYLLGLLISALAPNQNSAQIILIAFLVPQFLFAGVLQPLDKIPLGNVISPFISTRWTFEAFVKSTGLGDVMNSDVCWNMPKEQRNGLTREQKEVCLCMGPQLFNNCSKMPGILSPDFYTEDSQVALAQPEPQEPLEPTRIPSPTRRATPTLWSTPTYLPTPTFYPTPTAHNTPTAVPYSLSYNENVCKEYQDDTQYSVEAEMCMQSYTQGRMDSYQKTREAQYQEYSETREAQFEDYKDDTLEQSYEYRDDTEAQVEDYKEKVEGQADEFVELETGSYEAYGEQAFQQFEDYADEMTEYGDVRADWERKRQEAIGAAEAILGMIYDDYGRAFKGSVLTRWLFVILVTFAEFILILIFQKRKDVV